MSNTGDLLKEQTRAEIAAYRKAIEMSRLQAHNKAVQMYQMTPEGEERRLRERAIWARHTLGTVDLELAVLKLVDQLEQYAFMDEAITPLRIEDSHP